MGKWNLKFYKFAKIFICNHENKNFSKLSWEDFFIDQYREHVACDVMMMLKQWFYILLCLCIFKHLPFASSVNLPKTRYDLPEQTCDLPHTRVRKYGEKVRELTHFQFYFLKRLYRFLGTLLQPCNMNDLHLGLQRSWEKHWKGHV